MSNFYQLARRFPPVFVRLLARENGRAMSNSQIAHEMRHAHPRRVITINPEDAAYTNFEWDYFTLEEIRTFTRACHLDLTSRADVNRAECYLRTNGGKPSFKYLINSGEWGSYYLPLLLNWRKSMTAISTDLPKPIQNLLKHL